MSHWPGQVLPVDLDMLGTILEGDMTISTGGYLDLRTGRVCDEGHTDPMLVGEDAAIDVEAEPDRWLRFECTGSRDGWRDMAAFAERQHDAALRERLERAIEGRARSAGSATSSTRRTSPNSGTSSAPTANSVVPASSSPARASGWVDGQPTPCRQSEGAPRPKP